MTQETKKPSICTTTKTEMPDGRTLQAIVKDAPYGKPYAWIYVTKDGTIMIDTTAPNDFVIYPITE